MYLSASPRRNTRTCGGPSTAKVQRRTRLGAVAQRMRQRRHPEYVPASVVMVQVNQTRSRSGHGVPWSRRWGVCLLAGCAEVLTAAPQEFRRGGGTTGARPQRVLVVLDRPPRCSDAGGRADRLQHRRREGPRVLQPSIGIPSTPPGPGRVLDRTERRAAFDAQNRALFVCTLQYPHRRKSDPAAIGMFSEE